MLPTFLKLLPQQKENSEKIQSKSVPAQKNDKSSQSRSDLGEIQKLTPFCRNGGAGERDGSGRFFNDLKEGGNSCP